MGLGWGLLGGGGDGVLGGLAKDVREGLGCWSWRLCWGCGGFGRSAGALEERVVEEGVLERGAGGGGTGS